MQLTTWIIHDLLFVLTLGCHRFHSCSTRRNALCSHFLLKIVLPKKCHKNIFAKKYFQEKYFRKKKFSKKYVVKNIFKKISQKYFCQKYTKKILCQKSLTIHKYWTMPAIIWVSLALAAPLAPIIPGLTAGAKTPVGAAPDVCWHCSNCYQDGNISIHSESCRITRSTTKTV